MTLLTPDNAKDRTEANVSCLSGKNTTRINEHREMIAANDKHCVVPYLCDAYGHNEIMHTNT